MGAKKRFAPLPATSVATPAMMMPGLSTGVGPVSLEQAVIADPDDLDARRVLSDALLEQGDPRGEYMRLALYRDSLDRWDDEVRTIDRALHTLESRYGRAWSNAVAGVAHLGVGLPGWGSRGFEFDRGCIEELKGDARDLCACLAGARAVAPICALELLDDDRARKHVDELVAAPELASIRRLDIAASALSPKSFDKLFNGSHLTKLESLDISGLRPEHISVLARSPALAELSALTVSCDEPIGADGLRQLIDAGVTANLEFLSLDRCNLRGPGAQLLAQLAGLQTLIWSDDEPGVTGAMALAESTALSSLRDLDLSDMPLGERGAVAIVSSPTFAELRELSLDGVGLNAKRIPAMLAAFKLPKVKTLSLCGGPLRKDGAAAIAASDALRHVEELAVAGNSLGDAGAVALAAARLPKLQRLDLSGNAIAAAGMQALATGPLLANVVELDVRNNKCQNAGALALARWPNLPRVEALQLYYNWMGVSGLRAIVEQLDDAEDLFLGENNYGVEPVRALSKSTRITKLRKLQTRDADAKWLLAFARSPAAQNLESLHLSSSQLDEEAAKALLELPSFGRLSLSFTTVEGNGMGLLREALGPYLSLWPPGYGAA